MLISKQSSEEMPSLCSKGISTCKPLGMSSDCEVITSTAFWRQKTFPWILLPLGNKQQRWYIQCHCHRKLACWESGAKEGQSFLENMKPSELWAFFVEETSLWGGLWEFLPIDEMWTSSFYLKVAGTGGGQPLRVPLLTCSKKQL